MLAGSHMAMPAACRGRTGTNMSPAAKHTQPHSYPSPTICPQLVTHSPGTSAGARLCQRPSKQQRRGAGEATGTALAWGASTAALQWGGGGGRQWAQGGQSPSPLHKAAPQSFALS